jgi:hypothetical protein
VIFITHILFYLAIVVPSALYLMWSFSWLRAVVHLVLVVVSLAPFTHILHNHTHNKGIFKKQYGVLNHVVDYVLCPFLGHTWNTYFYHHIKHHHVEGNGPWDLSSTLRYQRDSCAGFAVYFARFYFLTCVELPLYFLKRGRAMCALYAGIGEIGCQLTFMWLLFCSSNPLGALFAFVIPMNILRLGMMIGNWGQHALVAKSDPGSDYLSSITCINHMYNRDCFNDGYHTSHHLNPQRHWEDHTRHLVSSQQTYAIRGALVFQNIDFSGVWFRLMTKDWDHLARCLVQLEDGTSSTTMTHAEIIQLLKDRVTPFTQQDIDSKYTKSGRRIVPQAE